MELHISVLKDNVSCYLIFIIVYYLYVVENKSLSLSHDILAGFLCVLKNLENDKYIFHAWKSHGSLEKQKLMENHLPMK